MGLQGCSSPNRCVTTRGPPGRGSSPAPDARAGKRPEGDGPSLGPARAEDSEKTACSQWAQPPCGLRSRFRGCRSYERRRQRPGTRWRRTHGCQFSSATAFASRGCFTSTWRIPRFKTARERKQEDESHNSTQCRAPPRTGSPRRQTKCSCVGGDQPAPGRHASAFPQLGSHSRCRLLRFPAIPRSCQDSRPLALNEPGCSSRPMDLRRRRLPAETWELQLAGLSGLWRTKVAAPRTLASPGHDRRPTCTGPAKGRSLARG